jgi:hypothetical protein
VTGKLFSATGSTAASNVGVGQQHRRAAGSLLTLRVVLLLTNRLPYTDEIEGTGLSICARLLRDCNQSPPRSHVFAAAFVQGLNEDERVRYNSQLKGALQVDRFGPSVVSVDDVVEPSHHCAT